MQINSLPGLPHLKPGTLYCIGRNYAEHARELDNEIPAEPVVFIKPSSSLIYDGNTIVRPSQSKNVHHEVELVVAIGKGGKHISQNEALSHIAGYAVGIDVTARDIQQKAKEHSLPWSIAKGFDTFAPLSSFIAAEKIDNPQNINLTLTVNGQQRQKGNTELMIFPVAQLISFLSGIFTLKPGDLIFTGTPKGVSPIQAGDVIEAEIDQSLISLSVTVV